MDESGSFVAISGGEDALTDRSTRLDLGWRLLAFVILAAMVVLGVLSLAPSGVIWTSAALLLGATVSGWILLAGDGRKPSALGFHLSWEAGPEMGKGLGLGVLIGLVVIVGIAAVGGLRWVSEGGSLTSWVIAGFGALVFLVVPAAAEEALLRGYPFQALSEMWGAGKGLIVTSGVFGLLHVWNPGATLLATLNVAAAGLLLGVVFLRTGSLWWTTGVHVGWNFAHGYLADVPVSGLEVMDSPLYEGVPVGPEWLGGGAFGPEGSVMATVVVLSAAAAGWWGPWLRPGKAALTASPLVLVQR
jgi:membrane protease YdiL (CAAX protease family)